MPHILDLPTELLINVFTDLDDASDFGSCLLTCQRLNAIIQDSCLLRYLIHTALAGVHDPLFQSGPPLRHRLESLERLSDAWRQAGAYLRSPSRVLTRTSKGSMRTDFILCDDYLIALDFGGRRGSRHVAGYEWLDLRNPSDGWAKIQFEENLIPLAVAFDAEREYLLGVLFGCPESPTFQLRLLEFHDGSPHPLASQPCVDITLPTKETHYIGLKTHMSMMGPYIIVAAGLPPEGTGIDVLFLVDWRKGHVTTLYSTQTRTYLTDFLVLSDDVLALIRGPENAIELCRLDTANSTASLQTISLLELPPLVSYARLTSASLKTESNPSKSTAHPHPSRRSTLRPPPRHSFSPSPTKDLVLLTLTAKIVGSAFVDTRTYTLAVHARTLLSYASPSSHVSRSSLPPKVPWDTWGLLATRCFEAPTSSSSPRL
ncbi:hypothetical protein BGY98DRAFT_1099844 [Russula aff. rugulosa BPL654]|nr:hypothetical protein BGY98DRAFT_1099844 [Russula aff. rugulosa BPL654]